MTFANIKTRARMAETLRRSEQAGDTWHSPRIRAAMAGDLRFTIVVPGARVPLRILDMQRDPRPLVVVLGADGLGPETPDAFTQSRHLTRWAAWMLLHGAGGEAWHYGFAVEAAALLRRVLIVETTGAALPAWVALKGDAARETPGFIVQVPPGKPAHPCETAPTGMVLQ